MDGHPIQARPVSKLEQASRWCRRRPALASLLAVLVVTVASSLVGLLNSGVIPKSSVGEPRVPSPVPPRATKRLP